MGLVKLNDRGVRSATTFGSVSGGSMTFIKKITASSSATVSFVDGTSDVVLDDTYKEYLFTFKDIHPATDSKDLNVGFRDGGSAYDAVKTSSFFWSYHAEDDSETTLAYSGSRDLAQSTDFQPISANIGNDNDQSGCGTLHLFNPSSTTFVKHFIARTNIAENGDYTIDSFTAGYINTTTAIDGVQFKMNSGNMDSGDICLYGIK